ncbi:MAG: hypothetical protein N3E50_04285 [Candidatus Goldbacteria bacterium]|nr:hypothetical protein [Candidatus Goldiibacteriota bacterium]
MNINFTSLPFIEKFFVYGGIFVSSVFIIILSSLTQYQKSYKKLGILFFYISIIFTFFSDIFLFFYTKYNFETIAGIMVNRVYLFLLISVICCYLFMFNEYEKMEDCILGLIIIITMQLIFISPSFIVIYIGFIIFEIAFSSIYCEIKPQKYFYIFMSLIFTTIFLLYDKTKIQAIGLNGSVIFLLLSTFAADRTVNTIAIREREESKEKNIIFLTLTVTFAVFFKLIEFFNSWTPMIYPIFIISFILLLLSVYNLLTEENMKSFFISDFVNILFLSLLCFSVINVNNVDILLIITVLLFVSILLDSFFSNSKGQYTVSYIKYNFNRIKGAGNLFLAIILTFFMEIYLIYRIINNFIYFNPYVQTVFLIVGFVYSINILNKLFIIFSMIMRIRIDNLKYILFNKIIIRPVLFVMFFISLFSWWIKNG